MKQRFLKSALLAAILAAALASGQQTEATPSPAGDDPTKRQEELQKYYEGPPLETDKHYYAAFNTNVGIFVARLFSDTEPHTVRNFVNLAEGTKPWNSPRQSGFVKEPYYDGVLFHRVVSGFVVQTGCPVGTGKEGPGYVLPYELDPNQTFNNEDCLLAMSKASPGMANGGQFFITDRDAHPGWLNHQYPIFGEVVEGKDIVNRIASVPKRPDFRPWEPVRILKVQIIRIPKGTDLSTQPWKSSVRILTEFQIRQFMTAYEVKIPSLVQGGRLGEKGLRRSIERNREVSTDVPTMEETDEPLADELPVIDVSE